jgi:phosphoribosyl-ATP pyrophosphohydrolase/phosphoribosyl-AMP cyclohydrolase
MFIDKVKFDDKGLVPAIAQDCETGEVLMLAYMNREALEKSVETGLAHYFSRSRQKLWMKGESSGHRQHIKAFHLDCDSDTLLIKVVQDIAACHTGHYSCFFRKVDGDNFTLVSEKIFDEEKVYGN